MHHYGDGLKKFGKIIGKEKYDIDYDNIEFNQSLIEYNKRDLELTRDLYFMLEKIYKGYGVKVKGTISSVSFEIYNYRFFGGKWVKIDDKILREWRQGYKGGWNEVFMLGEYYNDRFYYIDVNSLYPYVMMSDYPDLEWKICKKGDINNDINDKYWLGVNIDSGQVYNNIEHNDIVYHNNIDYYYIFNKKCYPFRSFIRHFYNKRLNTNNDFEKYIFKRIMNSLYGKFGMSEYYEKIIKCKFSDIMRYKNIIGYEEIQKGIYRIKIRDKGKYWNNIIWALFTTAKARKFMRDMYNEFRNKGITIYYVDTDGFIISGDIEKIKDYIGNDIGQFKIQKVAYEINIKGKKLYKFNNEYVVKGVSKENAKEFFENGRVIENKMVRVKTAFNTGVLIGSFKEMEKRNIYNEEWQKAEDLFDFDNVL
jgi:hypothetical protein